VPILLISRLPKALTFTPSDEKRKPKTKKREKEKSKKKEDKILDRKTMIFLFYFYIVYFREKTLEQGEISSTLLSEIQIYNICYVHS